MKRKVLLFFLFLCLPIFILSIFMVNVEANEPNGEKAIQVALAGDVDQNGAPVLTNDVGTVQITESTSIYGNTNGLSSEANEGYSFAFYLENNFVISTNPNYTFRTTEDHNFIAFFRPVAKKQVLVVDANNKYLGSMLVDEGTILQTTDLDKYHAQIKAKPGYQFEKWDAVFPLTVEKDFTIIRATYKTINNEIFTVNIYSDGEALIDTKEVNYGKTTTITAPTVEGKAFSHWTVDGQVMSYNNTHTFSVYGPVNVQAVYSEEEVNPVGVSYLSKTTVSDESVMYFILQTFVPTGYSVIEQGMIYKDSAVELAENILIGDEGISRTRAIRISPNSEFAISLNTLNNHLLYVRGYLVIADEVGNTEVIYSDQLVRQFKYNINYHLDGGVNHASNKEYYSVYELPVTLNAPTKTGSNFKGWYLTSNFAGEAVTEINTIGDVNLYAKWEDISYDITYELNGGTLENPNSSYTQKDLPLTLQVPIKDGYNFVGWYDNASFTGNAVTNIPVGTLANQNLYAKWEISNYSITYNLNGGIFGFTSKEDLKMEFFRDFYTFVNPTESFAVFVHGVDNTSGYNGTWFLNSEYRSKTHMKNEKSINPELNYFINQPEYNAKWVPFFDMMDTLINQTNDTQYFWSMPDVGTIRLREYFCEERYQEIITTPTYAPKVTTFNINSVDIYLPTPRKTGHKFLGWYDNANFIGGPLVKISNGSLGNKTLYAKWEQLAEYSITITLDGGTVQGIPAKYIANDLPISLHVPIKEGHAFLGWYDNPEYTGSPITELGFNTTGNIALYAKWAAAEQYNISYTLNSGIWGYPDKATMIKSFFKDLYVYINPAEDFDTFVHGEGLTTGYSGLWTTKNSYADKAFIQGNKTIDASLGVFINDPLYHDKWMPFFDLIEQLMVERKEGNTFWGSPFTGRARIRDYANNATFSAEQLARLPNFNPTITSYNIYSSEIRLLVPNRVGYSFAGWYETTDFSGPSVTTIPTGSTGNKVFNAKWVALTSYTITYNLNGGTLSSPINQYTLHTLPVKINVPTKSGSIFQGWYDNPEFNGKPITEIRVGSTGDKNLYAKWLLATSYTITLNYSRNYTTNTKNDMINDFLNDFYNYLGKPGGNLTTFMHGAGNTSGYAGTWYSNATYRDKLVNIPKPTTPNASLGFFVAHPDYYEKWMPFYDFMHQMSIDRNDTLFWSSAYTAKVRIDQYFRNASLPAEYLNKVPTFAPIVKTHNNTEVYTLPTPTMYGKTFGGWYDNSSFAGTPVTSVPKGSTGNKVFYAKWT